MLQIETKSEGASRELLCDWRRSVGDGDAGCLSDVRLRRLLRADL